jgi:hypothetical protein
MMVMSRKLDRDHPDLAGKLYAAFEKAKQLATEDVLDDKSGFSLIDLREKFLAQNREWGDLFPHGIKANRKMLDRLVEISRDFGLLKEAPSFEKAFAASTLAT